MRRKRMRVPEKKEGPFSGALSRYGVHLPRLIPAALPGILASLRVSRRENLYRYFFFFLPAFFLTAIFVFNLDFELVAGLFFVVTGIDTSLTVNCCRTSSETSASWATMASPSIRIIETCYS